MGSSKPRIGKILRLGVAHHEAGRLPQAEALYRQVLAMDPTHAECHYRLAMLAFRHGRGDLAISSLLRAVELAPRVAEYHLDLGIILSRLGHVLEAEWSFRAVLRLKPDDAQAHNGLGNALERLDRFEESIEHYREALRIKPDFAEAHYNLARVFGRGGLLREAEQLYREALRLKPDLPEAHNNLGQLLYRFGYSEEAAASCREALRLKPNYPEAQHNLGDVLVSLGRFEEAELCYREALRLKPNLPQTHRNLGNVLSDQHRFAEAVEYYRIALRLRPDEADALNGLGLSLSTLGQPAEAEKCFAEALRLKPDFSAARLNRCMEQLRIAYQDEEEIERARSAYAAELAAACRVDVRPESLTLHAIGGKAPFLLPYQGRCDRDLQAMYGGFVVRVMSMLFPGSASPPEVGPPRPGEAIRVGVLSAHFHNHSNWKIPIKGWLSHLDRERFQLFGYYLGHRQDSETALAKALCHRFVEGLASLNHWIEAIRADRLHVLLIPGIGMDTTTVRLAGLRLAPVQATSWGHPVTSGLPTIDDYLSSDLMEPPEGEAHYTERLVRLPNLSIHYEPLAVTPEAVSRAELGVSEDAVLYWCCQSLFKYLPRYDWVFARIATAVPNARFLFIEYPHGETVTGIFRRRLAAAFAAAGLDAERYCLFTPPMAMPRFTGITRIADVFLDSLGWSGCNSTLEALACDLPVVTMAGELMRARHSAAILTMLGMPDLIANTPEAFAELAAGLGRDKARRQALAGRIARDKHRLYRDEACIDGLARYLEEAAHGGVQRKRQGRTDIDQDQHSLPVAM
jgi:predicted O-linked N-acetylglucosamine transferase (SPINDLY family)